MSLGISLILGELHSLILCGNLLAQGTLGMGQDVRQPLRKSGKQHLLISRPDSEDANLLLFKGTKLTSTC